MRLDETIKRFLSGLVLTIIILITITYGNFYWFGLFVIIVFFAILGLKEFYTLYQQKDKSKQAPFLKLGIFFSTIILFNHYANFIKSQYDVDSIIDSLYLEKLIYYFSSDVSIVPLALLLLLFSSGILQIFFYSGGSGGGRNLAITLLGPLYTVITLSYAFNLLTFPQAPFYLLLFLLLPIATDTGAYIAGNFFGKHRLNFSPSPNKTYEGYFGGLLLACLVGLGFLYFWNEYLADNAIAISYGEVIIISVLIFIASIFGDLLESLFKRDVLIKDSGKIIPGHGGVLDLIDTIYWSFPLGYLYLSLRQVLGFSLG